GTASIIGETYRCDQGCDLDTMVAGLHGCYIRATERFGKDAIGTGLSRRQAGHHKSNIRSSVSLEWSPRKEVPWHTRNSSNPHGKHWPPQPSQPKREKTCRGSRSPTPPDTQSRS